MPHSRSLAGFMGRFTICMVFAGILFIGCKGEDGEMSAAQDVDFEMGEPITDTTFALIVSSSSGSDTLTTAEYRERFNLITMQYPMLLSDPSQVSELQRTILEDFVMQFAVMREADRLGLMADTAQVEMQLAQFRSQYPTPEAFQEALTLENLTEDSLRSSIRQYIRSQMLQEQIATGASQPTEEELQAFREEQAEEVRAQHILFMLEPGATAEQESTIQATAQAVLDSAQAGAPFDDLARRHSVDGSAQSGGDLGYFSRGDMVAPFEEAAFALADSGDITPELVRTQFGFHIIRLMDRRTTELMDTSQARQILYTNRQQEALQAELGRLRGTVTVRVNPEVVEVDLNAPRPEY
jgi:peptidyl-prolyl cis-trans isomerase C